MVLGRSRGKVQILGVIGPQRTRPGRPPESQPLRGRASTLLSLGIDRIRSAVTGDWCAGPAGSQGQGGVGRRWMVLGMSSMPLQENSRPSLGFPFNTNVRASIFWPQGLPQ